MSKWFRIIERGEKACKPISLFVLSYFKSSAVSLQQKGTKNFVCPYN